MDTPNKNKAVNYFGWLFVSAQFSLLALIIFLPNSVARPFTYAFWLSLVLVATGFILGLLAIFQMRQFLRVTPMPAPGAKLLRTGVYAIIRHPMYTALLLLAAGVSLFRPWYGWIVWLALLVVLVTKSRFEEKLLCKVFPDYPRYMEEVGGLLPKKR